MAGTNDGAGTRSGFGRLLTALVTPFTPDDRVDYSQAQRLAKALLETGSDGFIVSGTTGEAPTLSRQEKLDLFRAVKEAVGQEGAVLAGTSTYDTRESVELSREAERVGVDGLLLTVPYYSRPTQEGLFRHFEAIAAAVEIPGVIYNIPGRTGVNMLPETIIRAAAIPNLAGVKEASGSLDAVSKIAEEAGPGFSVWSGDDQGTLPLLSVGGYGVICVCSHLVGGQMKQMITDYVEGRPGQAAAAHRGLLPLMTALMTVAPNPIPVKHALNQIGFRVGDLRLPLYDLDRETSEKLITEVRRHRIELPLAV